MKESNKTLKGDLDLTNYKGEDIVKSECLQDEEIEWGELLKEYNFEHWNSNATYQTWTQQLRLSN